MYRIINDIRDMKFGCLDYLILDVLFKQINIVISCTIFRSLNKKLRKIFEKKIDEFRKVFYYYEKFKRISDEKMSS